MSKKFNTDHITNELKGSSSFFQKRTQEPEQNDVVTSPNDIMTSQADTVLSAATNELNLNEQMAETNQGGLDIEKLRTIIKSLSEIPTSGFTTPIRLSAQEKKDVEDFIYMTLRKHGIQGHQVSVSKLMRYCLRYLMKIHERELVTALKEALQKDTNLPI